MSELAWAAGFFDGEGSTTAWNDHDQWRRLRLQIGQKESEPLERFAAAVGGGSIYGPDSRNMYMYVALSQKALAALGQLWPYLCSSKRNQALRVAGLLTPLRQTLAVCSVADCERTHNARGFCAMHYQRWKRATEQLAGAAS